MIVGKSILVHTRRPWLVIDYAYILTGLEVIYLSHDSFSDSLNRFSFQCEVNSNERPSEESEDCSCFRIIDCIEYARETLCGDDCRCKGLLDHDHGRWET